MFFWLYDINWVWTTGSQEVAPFRSKMNVCSELFATRKNWFSQIRESGTQVNHQTEAKQIGKSLTL